MSKRENDKSKTTKQKNDRLYLRISADDYDKIAAKAAACGVSLSDYVRTAALDCKKGAAAAKAAQKAAARPTRCGCCGAVLPKEAQFCVHCGQVVFDF